MPCASPPGRAFCVIAPNQRTDRIIMNLFCACVCDDREACRVLRTQIVRFFVAATRQHTDRITRQLRVPALVVTKKPRASPRVCAAFVTLPRRQRTVHFKLQLRLPAFVVTKKLAARFASSARGVRYHLAAFVSSCSFMCLRLFLPRSLPRDSPPARASCVIASWQRTDRIIVHLFSCPRLL